jgi:hypothetical protein
MMTHSRRLFLIPALAFFVAACGGSEPDAAVAGGDGLPADHPPIAPGTTVPSTAVDPGSMLAVVLEIENAGGYTYALLDINGDQAWAAGPMTELEVGDEVAVTGGMPMRDFTSNALGRTFDLLYFVDAYHKAGESVVPDLSSAGSVLEVIPAGDYTYLHVETEAGEVWLAAPALEVAVGDQVAWEQGMPMANFESKTLNRTFDQILFLEAIQVR